MSQNAVEVKFFANVYKIPVVNSAVNAVADRYNGLRNKPLIHFAFDGAEKAVSLVAERATPMVNAFGSTISVADAIACQGLQKVEEMVPAVNMSSEELYKSGVQKYDAVKQYGNGKVVELKDYGYKKAEEVMATPYGSAVVKSLDSALAMTEYAVNHYLPPKSGEQPMKIEGNIFQKVSTLSEVTRRRVYEQALVQVQKLEKMKESPVKPIVEYITDWRDYGYKKATNVIDETQKNVKWFWEEVKKTESDQKGLIMSVARNTTQQVVKTYEKVVAQVPDGIKNIAASGYTYSKNVYDQMAKAGNVKQVAMIAYHELSKGAHIVKNVTVETLRPYIPKLAERKAKSD